MRRLRTARTGTWQCKFGAKPKHPPPRPKHIVPPPSHKTLLTIRTHCCKHMALLHHTLFGTRCISYCAAAAGPASAVPPAAAPPAASAPPAAWPLSASGPAGSSEGRVAACQADCQVSIAPWYCLTFCCSFASLRSRRASLSCVRRSWSKLRCSSSRCEQQQTKGARATQALCQHSNTHLHLITPHNTISTTLSYATQQAAYLSTHSEPRVTEGSEPPEFPAQEAGGHTDPKLTQMIQALASA